MLLAFLKECNPDPQRGDGASYAEVDVAAAPHERLDAVRAALLAGLVIGRAPRRRLREIDLRAALLEQHGREGRVPVGLSAGAFLETSGATADQM